MIVERRPIYSSASLDRDEPWYNLACTTRGVLTIGADANRRKGVSPLAGSRTSLNTLIASAQTRAVAPGEVVLIAITEDDELVVETLSEHQGIYHAHLGYYDPATDTLTLLEFLER